MVNRCDFETQFVCFVYLLVLIWFLFCFRACLFICVTVSCFFSFLFTQLFSCMLVYLLAYLQHHSNFKLQILVLWIISLLCFLSRSCNTHSASPPQLAVAVAGTESYISAVLQPYVEQFSSKPSDWQTFLRFLLIPLG